MGSRTQKKKGKRKRGKMLGNASLPSFFLSVHPVKSTVYRGWSAQMGTTGITLLILARPWLSVFQSWLCRKTRPVINRPLSSSHPFFYPNAPKLGSKMSRHQASFWCILRCSSRFGAVSRRREKGLQMAEEKRIRIYKGEAHLEEEDNIAACMAADRNNGLLLLRFCTLRTVGSPAKAPGVNQPNGCRRKEGETSKLFFLLFSPPPFPRVASPPPA